METLNKKETIKTIMSLLDSGKTVYIKDGDLNMRGELWETYAYNSNRKIIKWQHFGSSANRRTIKELTWVINTIFKCKNKDIVYTCN